MKPKQNRSGGCQSVTSVTGGGNGMAAALRNLGLASGAPDPDY